jgi:hypothetical protein
MSMTHDLNVYMAKSSRFSVGQHVVADWQHCAAHGTITKVNPLSVRVVIDDEGQWKGLELTLKLMAGGQNVYPLDDPLIQKWLAKHPAPPVRASQSEVESKKTPRTLPGNFDRKGVIPKNQFKVIDKIFSNVKSVYLFHYDEMSGGSNGMIETALIPQMIKSALKDLTSHGAYIRNDGAGAFTVHVHSNLHYTFYTK